jgi:aromatic ring hydroxylase
MCSVRNGIAIPDALIVNIAKLHFAQGLHTAFQYVQDIAGGLLATYPADEDFDHPTYGVKLERYFAAGGNTGGRERLRLLRMISDLTTGDYGGYQTILAIHAEGSIEAEKLTILSHAKRDAYIAYARWLAGLDDSRWPPRSDNAGAAFGDLS